MFPELYDVYEQLRGNMRHFKDKVALMSPKPVEISTASHTLKKKPAPPSTVPPMPLERRLSKPE